uniref:Uncharacterized protein n=1 Tax=Talaromyces marneffei PM1 TaxID=1077442 RepID=A0A093Y835_TALMA
MEGVTGGGLISLADIVRWNGSDHLQNRVVGEYVGPTF